MKRKILSLLMAGAMVMSLAACGGSDSATTEAAGEGSAVEEEGTSSEGETYHWRMAHEEYEGDMQDVYCKEFIQKLNEKSGGRITVDLYPVGQLGDAVQQCELLQNNALEFAIISPGNTGTIVPENQLFSLHYLFPQDWDKTLEVLKTSEALNVDLAQKYLDNTPIIRGINGTELVELILKYYEDLSEKYRKMIPLKQVYIPVPKEE